MKKKATALLLFAAIIASLLSFASCGNKDDGGFADGGANIKNDTAYRMLYEADKKLSQLDSYTVSSTVDASVEISGATISIKGTGKERFSGLGGGELIHRKEMTTDVRSGNTAVHSVTAEGYHSGMAFLRFEQDGYANKVYSLITPEEYLEFYRANNESTLDRLLYDESLSSSTSVTTREDGGATVALTDFNDAFIEAASIEFGVAAFGVDASVEGISAICELSKDGNYESATVTITIGIDGERAVMTAVTTFTELGSTVAKKYPLSGYSLVSDVRLIYRAADAIDKMKALSSGSATLVLGIKLTQSGKVSEYKETDVINFNNANGLTYDITSTVENVAEVKTEYASGVKTMKTTVAGQEATVSETESTDAKELAYLYSLLDYASFDMHYVSGVELLESGALKLTLEVCDATKASKPSPDKNLILRSITLTLTFDDNGIALYETKLVYEGNSSASGAEYVITTECKFN